MKDGKEIDNVTAGNFRVYGIFSLIAINFISDQLQEASLIGGWNTLKEFWGESE
jgi:hypothetical protein